MLPCVTVRKYKDTDCEIVSELFYETIHHVNAKDYSQKQLFAWAKDAFQLQMRRADLLKQNTLVAELNGEIVGFGSITASGCLDLLFVHKDYQNRGIAAKLCDALEQGFPALVTYSSITAKPFFEKRGYTVKSEREVERAGVTLKNYEMCRRIHHG